MANLDGVPHHAGSLTVVGTQLRTLGQWRGWRQWTGKGNVGRVVLQAPNPRDSSPNAADTGDDIVRATHWGCRTGLNMKMEEVTGSHRRQVKSEEMHQKSKFLCDAFWAAMEELVFEKHRPCLLTEQGNKFYLLHTKKLRL